MVVFKKGLPMNELKEFLNSLSVKEQRLFAMRCGTSIAYLRKAISMKQTLGTEICVNIERETNGVVSRKALVPNWQARWPELVENHNRS